MTTLTFDFLAFRRILGVPGFIQATIIIILYILTLFTAFAEYSYSGKMFGYPLSISILFVPIYEEIIFRGLILERLTKTTTAPHAIILTSFLFALWHLKNIFFLDPSRVFTQVLFTGLIISPVLCLTTLHFRTIWPSVILHYLVNLAGPISVLFATGLLGAT